MTTELLLLNFVQTIVKGMSARYLRKEFPVLMKLPSMWTRSHFVSTAGQVSFQTIKEYIENQGKD